MGTGARSKGLTGKPDSWARESSQRKRTCSR